LAVAYPLEFNQALHVDLRQELLAGEELWAFSYKEGAWSLLVTGYRFVT
jgi:hypothetical protein